MRIIGGRHRGRRFRPPKNNPARPTTDIAKEALFNIIENNWDIENVKVLDLFGGTGSISFEFASRGAQDITTVELFGPNVQFIQQTSEELQLKVKALKMDAFNFIQNTREQFDIIFAGPPYPLPALDTLPDQVFQHGLLKQKGWFILEHSPEHGFSKHPHFSTVRNYGQTNFSIFTREQGEQ